MTTSGAKGKREKEPRKWAPESRTAQKGQKPRGSSLYGQDSQKERVMAGIRSRFGRIRSNTCPEQWRETLPLKEVLQGKEGQHRMGQVRKSAAPKKKTPKTGAERSSGSGGEIRRGRNRNKSGGTTRIRYCRHRKS